LSRLNTEGPLTEALNVQDNMAREASSGTVSVSPLARKVAFVPTLSLNAGGRQPPIDLKLRARWASLRGPVLRSLRQCAEQLLMFKIAAQRDGSYRGLNQRRIPRDRQSNHTGSRAS
jgi:hypothetical protein